jgi:hypothetical protein
MDAPAFSAFPEAWLEEKQGKMGASANDVCGSVGGNCHGRQFPDKN